MAKQFRAYAPGATNAYSPSPRAAALEFFKLNPGKRKCSLVQGEIRGDFFTVAYGRVSKGEWPTSYSDVTKKSALELPDEVPDANA